MKLKYGIPKPQGYTDTFILNFKAYRSSLLTFFFRVNSPFSFSCKQLQEKIYNHTIKIQNDFPGNVFFCLQNPPPKPFKYSYQAGRAPGGKPDRYVEQEGDGNGQIRGSYTYLDPNWTWQTVSTFKLRPFGFLLVFWCTGAWQTNGSFVLQLFNQ